MDTLPLFDKPAGGFDRERLRRKLADLARLNIFLGASSWKYEGWIGQIYSRERYFTRGRFSRKRFEEECLREYASTFPAVCGDFSFYQFPSEEYWRRLFHSAPPDLRYCFKAPEEITVKAFPSLPRYGARAAENNPNFLDARLFRAAFLDLLEPYRRQTAALILEFGAFPKQCYRDVEEFLAELDPFLAALPGTFRYAVEIRNPDFLGPQYFACLRERGVAHVLNNWSRMPEIGEQMQLPGVYTADFTLARALLRKGRAYEEAVEKFSPYREVRDQNPEARQALRELIARAREQDKASYIFVNNRLEGNAPQTIEAVVDDLAD